MASVNWKAAAVNVPTYYFDDLDDNASFKIRSGRSRGAVYRKVVYKDFSGVEHYYMMEEATGKLFEPTASQVEEVFVTVEIGLNKPNIY